jgi:hypothetical protein
METPDVKPVFYQQKEMKTEIETAPKGITQRKREREKKTKNEKKVKFEI